MVCVYAKKVYVKKEKSFHYNLNPINLQKLIYTGSFILKAFFVTLLFLYEYIIFLVYFI